MTDFATKIRANLDNDISTAEEKVVNFSDAEEFADGAAVRETDISANKKSVLGTILIVVFVLAIVAIVAATVVGIISFVGSVISAAISFVFPLLGIIALALILMFGVAVLAVIGAIAVAIVALVII